MPVRPLKKNYHRSVSGISFSAKNSAIVSFESTLERDFAYLQEFDLNVFCYEEQPVTIDFTDNNQFRRYTPDFLVSYRKDLELPRHFKPALVEVKYREDRKKNWKELKPKFLAAMRYADSQGWKFKIMTEVEIRTEYLFNAKFLLKYRHADHERGMMEQLLDTIRELRLSNPEELIKAATIDKNRRAELLHHLWYMIDLRIIGCDLNRKITMKSEIWALDTIEPKFRKP